MGAAFSVKLKSRRGTDDSPSRRPVYAGRARGSATLSQEFGWRERFL